MRRKRPQASPPGCGLQTRSAFLARAGLGMLGAVLASGTAWAGEPFGAAAPSPKRKGSLASKVKRWDIVTIGNLSRNRYWGESDAKGLRPAICTCTLIQGEGFRLVADPSLEQSEEMARELDRRAGCKLQDIDTVFVTHEHADHWAGLVHFNKARWLAGPPSPPAYTILVHHLRKKKSPHLDSFCPCRPVSFDA